MVALLEVGAELKLELKPIWKWLGIDYNGDAYLYSKKPKKYLSITGRIWTDVEGSDAHAFANEDFMKLPKDFSLFKRVRRYRLGRKSGSTVWIRVV